MRRGARHDPGTALIAIALGVGSQFLADQGTQALLGPKGLFQLGALCRQFGLLAANLGLLQLCQMAQFQFQNRFRSLRSRMASA